MPELLSAVTTFTLSLATWSINSAPSVLALASHGIYDCLNTATSHPPSAMATSPTTLSLMVIQLLNPPQ